MIANREVLVHSLKRQGCIIKASSAESRNETVAVLMIIKVVLQRRSMYSIS
jgi:hypothetical protein